MHSESVDRAEHAQAHLVAFAQNDRWTDDGDWHAVGHSFGLDFAGAFAAAVNRDRPGWIGFDQRATVVCRSRRSERGNRKQGRRSGLPSTCRYDVPNSELIHTIILSSRDRRRAAGDMIDVILAGDVLGEFIRIGDIAVKEFDLIGIEPIDMRCRSDQT
jgi:hypothetical protein